jgi:glutamate 5-kinase
MKSKLASTRLVTHSGGSVIIASGKRQEPLTRILSGEEVGTLILAEGQTKAARQRWIGLTVRPKGAIQVDPGARTALEVKGSSLLAIGVTGTRGEFEKGDVVSVIDPQGNEFARGLTNYSSMDTNRIQGLRTENLRKALQECVIYDEVIHRDNLLILPK